MKYAIFGDIHGEELKDLESAVQSENPDSVICTGDFDQIKTIHQVRKFEENCKKAGKEFIKVPGNHDHAILNGIPINSKALQKYGKSSLELHGDLMSDPIAFKYLSDLVNSKNPEYTVNRIKILLDENKLETAYPTIITHGGYDGDLSSFPECPDKIKNLWVRLRTPEDHKKNFEIMKNKGYKIMLRGHDHVPSYAYNDLEKGIVIYNTKKDDRYKLFLNRQHTITPGALSEGHFAVVDTNIEGEHCPVVEYKRL
jgi:predicted phosphodiesterase